MKAGATYEFAKEVNSVPLTAIEFAQAAAEYPIVFAGNEDAVMPVVVLGAQQTENLFVGENGEWLGKYVPAFVRRFPFVFSTDKSGRTFILHIDEDFKGCNREGRGERLFDNDGEQTQYLKNVLNFLQDYQARFQRTKQYCDRLKALELLQPMQAQFNLNTGERRSLSGFMTVNRDKLKNLSAEDLQNLFNNDELECTYLHLHSLRHFSDMLDRFPAAKSPEEGLAESAEGIEAAALSKASRKAPARKNGGEATA
ncbi:SapC family protein [Roseibium salinum]|uniref:SapC family protein n=1 Tax=Roseibium salinum TaxID=1604349 RepID=UPI0035EC541E